MGRREITNKLSDMLEETINPNNDPRIYYAKEVTFDYATSHSIRVDYVQFKPVDNSVGGIEKGDFYCYEIKSCIEDFNSGHGLNFIGDFNYLVMEEDLFQQLKTRLKSVGVGCYIPNDDYGSPLKCALKAKRRVRKYATSEMLLMMFRSSNRELNKIKKKRNKQCIETMNMIC